MPAHMLSDTTNIWTWCCGGATGIEGTGGGGAGGCIGGTGCGGCGSTGAGAGWDACCGA